MKPNERAPVAGLGLLFCLAMFEHGWDGTSLQRQFAFQIGYASPLQIGMASFAPCVDKFLPG